jgi:hypothetical protein
MISRYLDTHGTFYQLDNQASGLGARMIELNRSDCYMIHRYISEEFDCICEDLTWKNGLVFNTETFSHKDMYENLFKLEFKGVQLGQQY